MLAAADAMPRLPMTRTEIREMDAHRSLCLRVAVDTDDRHTVDLSQIMIFIYITRAWHPHCQHAKDTALCTRGIRRRNPYPLA